MFYAQSCPSTECEFGMLLLASRGSVAACRCGHGRDAHEHYRAGSDCGSCGRQTCPSFRRARASLRDAVRLAAHLGTSTGPLPHR